MDEKNLSSSLSGNGIGMTPNQYDVVCHVCRHISAQVRILCHLPFWSGPGSSVGIATGYGLDRPGIDSHGRDFPRPSRPALGPPSLLYNGYWVFPGGKTAGS